MESRTGMIEASGGELTAVALYPAGDTPCVVASESQ
jgi:hypothetical protein